MSIIKDPFLGKLKFEEGSYIGKIEIPSGNKVEIIIDPLEEKIEKVLIKTKNLLQWLDKNDMIAREFAAKKLLKTCNEEWSNGKKITEKEFVANIKIESLTIWSDGAMEVFYNARKLFRGHNLKISIEKGPKFSKVSI